MASRSQAFLKYLHRSNNCQRNAKKKKYLFDNYLKEKSLEYLLDNYFSGIFAIENQTFMCTGKWDSKRLKVIDIKQTETPLHCMAFFPGHQIHAGTIL